ncbi:MAG: endo alpha-1,4 polygalactosaminidase [Alphaproteobacteria bacterium]|nr:endo alpha-1,4 polygalactosaminidase [Alphaproteobacteria bacterium]
MGLGRAALAAFVVLAGAAEGGSRLPTGDHRFAVYYAAVEPAASFQRYDVIAFDGDTHPPLDTLKSPNRVLLGYISLGEVEGWRPYYKQVEAEGITLMENENWKHSYMVDLRRPEWTRRIVEDIAAAILAKGFDGLFLDTMDNAGHLERLDPARFKGMTQAGADLILALRKRHPGALLMLNRGYEVLPLVEHAIDAVLAEATFATMEFKSELYGLVRKDLHRKQVDLLRAAKARRPALMLYSLDYWEPDNPEGIAKIYRAQRAEGFVPYVATIKLDRLVPEPGR